MGRDPEDGLVTAPATLHKYLYASGDPTNRIDPSGRGDEVEVGLTNSEISEGSEAGEEAVAREENCALDTAASALGVVVAPSGESLLSLAADFAHCKAKAKKRCTSGGSIGAVVIGETMARVIPFAQSIGAGFYIPPVGAPPSMWMENNKQWINDVMDQGCKVLDGGLDMDDRGFSPYYAMEREQIELRGYPTTPVKLPSLLPGP